MTDNATLGVLAGSAISAAMARALELGKRAASLDEVPVGAVILDAEGTIIGEGHNLRESQTDPCAHAEIIAIRAASQRLGAWRLTGCTLVVTLEPCPMCLGASQAARLQRVVFAATDPKGGALSLGYRLHEDTRTNHRFSVETLDAPEAGALLTEFFRRKRGV